MTATIVRDDVQAEIRSLTHAQLADLLVRYRDYCQSYRAAVAMWETAARLRALDGIGPAAMVTYHGSLDTVRGHVDLSEVTNTQLADAISGRVGAKPTAYWSHLNIEAVHRLQLLAEV